MDDFARLIAGAGRLLGLDGLEPDGDGVVEFEESGDGSGAPGAPVSVTVQFVPEAGDMVLWSAGVLPATGADAPVASDADAMRLALEANFRSSETVSLDPTDGSLVLTDYAPLRALSPETFVARLESFAAALLSCRRKLAEGAAAGRSRESGGSRSRATEAEDPPFGQPGILAV